MKDRKPDRLSIVQKLPDMNDRQVMQALLSGKWKMVHVLGIALGPARLARLLRVRWIELREHNGKQQIRLTPLGLEAFRAKLPSY